MFELPFLFQLNLRVHDICISFGILAQAIHIIGLIRLPLRSTWQNIGPLVESWLAWAAAWIESGAEDLGIIVDLICKIYLLVKCYLSAIQCGALVHDGIPLLHLRSFKCWRYLNLHRQSDLLLHQAPRLFILRSTSIIERSSIFCTCEWLLLKFGRKWLLNGFIEFLFLLLLDWVEDLLVFTELAAKFAGVYLLLNSQVGEF